MDVKCRNDGRRAAVRGGLPIIMHLLLPAGSTSNTGDPGGLAPRPPMTSLIALDVSVISLPRLMSRDQRPVAERHISDRSSSIKPGLSWIDCLGQLGVWGQLFVEYCTFKCSLCIHIKSKCRSLTPDYELVAGRGGMENCDRAVSEAASLPCAFVRKTEAGRVHHYWSTDMFHRNNGRPVPQLMLSSGRHKSRKR